MGVLEAFIICPSYLIRKGLRHVLNNHPGIQVVLEMKDTLTLVTELESRQPSIIFCTPESLTEIDIHQYDSITWVALTEGMDNNTDYGFDAVIDIGSNAETLMDRLHAIESNATGSSAETAVTLSDREIDVLREVVTGFLNKEIADHLFISPHTVITHRKNITRKLGIRTVAGLTVYAILNGIISLQDVARDENTENRNT